MSMGNAAQAPAADSEWAAIADRLRRRDPMSRIKDIVLDRPALMRLVLLVMSWGTYLMPWRETRTIYATDYDTVRNVLADDRAFPVPFDERFMEMDRTRTNFMLGMPEDARYRAIRAQVASALPFTDIAWVTRRAGEHAAELVDRAAPNYEIDAMGDLLTEVPLRLVQDYFGVPVRHEADLVFWSMAMSSYAFSNPGEDAAGRSAGRAAAQRLGRVVDAAIEAALAGPDNPDTVLGRLVIARRRMERLGQPPLLTDHVLRATMIGLINGFVPTNAKAGAKILAVLLNRPEALRVAEQAAQDGDDDLLRRCLFEALRFKHALPVIFRRCAVDEYALGRWRKVRKGMYVGAAVQVAAFDPRRVEEPSRFDPARDAADSLGLGYGQHRCIGFAFAAAQITATFRPLLLQGNLHSIKEARGQPVRFASFVERHRVAFGTRPVR